MICPHCGKEITLPEKTQKTNKIYTRFLKEWNDQGVIIHKKVTTRMKKAIDKAIKNADYTEVEIFKAFVNYSQILRSPDFTWSYKWTMEDFLNRGLYKFVDESLPFSNDRKGVASKNKNPYENFSCGG